MSVVLVATNGSEACRRAVARTAELFPGTATVVATVVPGGDRGGTTARSHPMRGVADRQATVGVRAIADDLALDAAHRLLAEACGTIGDHARPLLLTGDPVEALIGAVRSTGAGTLVVGSLGRGAVADVLSAAVGTALVRHLPCTVIELG